MRLRTRPGPRNLIRSQQQSIILPGGKAVRICSEARMAEMAAAVRQRAITEAAYDQKQLTEEEVAEAERKWRQECGLATMKSVLEKMTPVQQERLRDQYRFGGVCRRWG